jgi:hypothetical protein
MITVERDLLQKTLQVLAYDTDDRYGKKAEIRCSLREALGQQGEPSSPRDSDTETLDECYKAMTAALGALDSDAGHRPIMEILMNARHKIEQRRSALKKSAVSNNSQLG